MNYLKVSVLDSVSMVNIETTHAANLTLFTDHLVQGNHLTNNQVVWLLKKKWFIRNHLCMTIYCLHWERVVNLLPMHIKGGNSVIVGVKTDSSSSGASCTHFALFAG